MVDMVLLVSTFNCLFLFNIVFLCFTDHQLKARKFEMSHYHIFKKQAREVCFGTYVSISQTVVEPSRFSDSERKIFHGPFKSTKLAVMNIMEEAPCDKVLIVTSEEKVSIWDENLRRKNLSPFILIRSNLTIPRNLLVSIVSRKEMVHHAQTLTSVNWNRIVLDL